MRKYTSMLSLLLVICVLLLSSCDNDNIADDWFFSSVCGIEYTNMDETTAADSMRIHTIAPDGTEQNRAMLPGQHHKAVTGFMIWYNKPKTDFTFTVIITSDAASWKGRKDTMTVVYDKELYAKSITYNGIRQENMEGNRSENVYIQIKQ